MPSHAAGAIPGLILGEPFEEDDGTGEFGLIEAANHRAGGLSGLASLAPSWLFHVVNKLFPLVPNVPSSKSPFFLGDSQKIQKTEWNYFAFRLNMLEPDHFAGDFWWAERSRAVTMSFQPPTLTCCKTSLMMLK